jgi:hypothetical protein
MQAEKAYIDTSKRMEATMNMQGMPGMAMDEMHNTFWRKEQVAATFHSATPLVSTDGMNQGGIILDELNLELQRQRLNAFLAQHGVNFTLNFYQPVEPEVSRQSHPMKKRHLFHPRTMHQGRESFTPPPGVYLFGLSEPIRTKYGELATSVVAFFDFTPNRNTQPGMSGMKSEMGDSPADDEDSTGFGDDGDGEEPPPRSKLSPVIRIVNTFNRGLDTLNSERVPIGGASPNWLWGGTPYTPQGCPSNPPIPVGDACSFWHFHLPMLSPGELQSMTGEGVTVFVLDTLPEREVISRAATRAGDDNLLLFDVERNVTFNYDIWNYWTVTLGDPPIPPLAVGKDVYDRHFAFRMPDHGLFIAGIVHDIAPHARVECIRIMGNFCVGDSNIFLSALQYIQNRMLPGGDLYQKPVVINLSNVMPTLEEAKSAGLDLKGVVTASVLASVYNSILALAQSGAIVVASAGNEADLRKHSSGIRPAALHPAAFGNPPDPGSTGIQAIHGVIPVGAVDKYSNTTSYSCYPGPNGIATYGGEVPDVEPDNPPSNDPDVIISDAVRGIYSAAHYPPESKDPPARQYKAPNNRGWAYWVGTSFATPVISAVAARVLELKLRGGPMGDVPGAIIGAGGAAQTLWNNLDDSGTSAHGPMLLAVQECQVMEEDDED